MSNDNSVPVTDDSAAVPEEGESPLIVEPAAGKKLTVAARKATALRIIKKARTARSKLAVQESKIQTEINSIDDIEWERQLTEEERDQRRQLRLAQTNVRSAMNQLSFVTVRAIDQAPEVTRMINAFEAVNRDLTKDIEDIHEAAAVAKAIQNVVAQIADIVANAAKLIVPV